MRKPDYYKAPLRSRQQIVDFILKTTDQRIYNYVPHPFCFNVKVHNCNLDFDHLLQLWRENENDPLYTHDADWLKSAKEKHEEVGVEAIYERGQEDACNHFLDVPHTLWDDTEVDVAYSFEGRSGGWLSINNFEGYNFNTHTDIRQVLAEMDYPTLRKFYQLIVMLQHDTADPEKEIEYWAADNFFANTCWNIKPGNQTPA